MRGALRCAGVMSVVLGLGALAPRVAIPVGIALGLGVPIDMVSTGPDRDHTILLRHPYL